MVRPSHKCPFAVALPIILALPMPLSHRFGKPTPTPQPWQSAISGIREFVSGAALALRCAGKLQMHLFEDLGRSVVGAQAQDQLATAVDQPPRSVYQLLNHGLDATPLGAVAHRRVRPEQAPLAYQAQDVHRQRR